MYSEIYISRYNAMYRHSTYCMNMYITELGYKDIEGGNKIVIIKQFIS